MKRPRTAPIRNHHTILSHHSNNTLDNIHDADKRMRQTQSIKSMNITQTTTTRREERSEAMLQTESKRIRRRTEFYAINQIMRKAKQSNFANYMKKIDAHHHQCHQRNSCREYF